MPVRHFTAYSLSNCELLSLSLSDIRYMKIEFIEIFNELFDGTS